MISKYCVPSCKLNYVSVGKEDAEVLDFLWMKPTVRIEILILFVNIRRPHVVKKQFEENGLHTFAIHTNLDGSTYRLVMLLNLRNADMFVFIVLSIY